MKCYKFRVILDCKKDVFRDILISSEANLEALHNVIKTSFDLKGDEMASFYMSNDEWYQGSEISLMDISEDDDAEIMNKIKLKDALKEKGAKMIYLYDFMEMWTFFCELIDVEEKELKEAKLSYRFGERPEKAPQQDMDISLDLGDLDDYDEDSGFENIDDLDNIY